ncbi:MAG: PhoH family protein [Clostridium fessum]
MAIQAFSGEVSRIILTRPAIEAGEKLGFLPGDLQSRDRSAHCVRLRCAVSDYGGRKVACTILRRA